MILKKLEYQKTIAVQSNIFRLIEPSEHVDFAHFDLLTFCPEYQRSIFKFINVDSQGRIYRRRLLSEKFYSYQNSKSFYHQLHEDVFGQLLYREILFRMVEKYNELGYYQEAVGVRFISEVVSDITEHHWIPVLYEYKTEKELIDKYQYLAKAKQGKLLRNRSIRDVSVRYQVQELGDIKMAVPVIYYTWSTLKLVEYIKLSPIPEPNMYIVLNQQDIHQLVRQIQKSNVKYFTVDIPSVNFEYKLQTDKFTQKYEQGKQTIDYQLSFVRQGLYFGQYYDHQLKQQCMKCQLRQICNKLDYWGQTDVVKSAKETEE